MVNCEYSWKRKTCEITSSINAKVYYAFYESLNLDIGENTVIQSNIEELIDKVTELRNERVKTTNQSGLENEAKMRMTSTIIQARPRFSVINFVLLPAK